MKSIGVLQEPNKDLRVSLLPQAVDELVRLKNQVWVEQGLGHGIGLTDQDYAQKGAKVVTRSQALKQADIITTINLPNGLIPDLLDKSILGVYNPLYFKDDLLKFSNNTRIYSLDLLPRTTLAQNMDVLSSMASLSGYKAVLFAANYVSKPLPMFTTAAGTLRPAKVLVLGAGVAGLQAIATAKRLGAEVEAFDVRSSAEEEVKSLGANFIKVEGSEESKNSGGYAVEQSINFQRTQRLLIHEHCRSADIVISTANIPGKKAPVLISESTVKKMQAGSVIVDLASEQGGNCELSQNNKIQTHYGVTVIGNSHFSRAIPKAASQLLSTNFINFLKLWLNDPGNQLIKSTLAKNNQEKIPVSPLN